MVRGERWVFSGIYCKGNREERECLWDDLGKAKTKWGER